MRKQTLVISVVTVWASSLPTGATHLQRQPFHSGWKVGSSWRGGGGRTGTPRRLARRRSRDGQREGGEQEEGGVVPEEQQHVTGM